MTKLFTLITGLIFLSIISTGVEAKGVNGKTLSGQATPVISYTTPDLTSISTPYGQVSLPTVFSVSATDLVSSILVTPPANFEVSLDNINFSPTVTVGSVGTLLPIRVFIRFIKGLNAGDYPGVVKLTTQNAAETDVVLPLNHVEQVKLTITVDDAVKTYGDQLSSLTGYTTFTSSGLVYGETIGSISVIFGNGAAAKDAAGIYENAVIPGSAAGGTFKTSNYLITYVSAKITVTKAVLTITAVNKTKQYGDPNPVFNVSYANFKNNETSADLTTLPVAATTATELSPAGVYPITVGGAVSANYDFIYIDGTLTVQPVYLPISIPNAFSPNGDGRNDTWEIANLAGYPGSTVEVFNRYGIKLFSSVGYGTPWNGMFNGNSLPAGIYYYLIDPKNGYKAVAGYITIIK